MIRPTENDVGRFVVYQTEEQLEEAGRISQVRPEFVHVRFSGNEHSIGCRRENLTWLDDLLKKPTPLSESELAAIAERAEYLTPSQIGDARADLRRVLQREAELVGLVHDLQQESAMLEQGRREERGRVVAILDACHHRIERQIAEAEHDGGIPGSQRVATWHAVQNTVRLTQDKVFGNGTLDTAPPLPPDIVRAENARLRAVLRQGMRMWTSTGSPTSVAAANEFIQAARLVLGEEPT